MKHLNLSLLRVVGLLLLLAVSAISQTKFSDPNVEYQFLLPSDNWELIVKPSEYSPNVEYVYKDKREGYLQVRKMSVDREDQFSELIRDEEQKLQFLPGYVAGPEENFNGFLKGRVFNYEFVRSGKNMSGRSYFLRFDPVTVYLLKFTGYKDSLRLIRNETDSIARSFGPKQEGD